MATPPLSPKTPLHLTAPFVWAGFILLCIGTYFQVTGPLSDATLKVFPTKISAAIGPVTIFLSKYGSFIGVALLVYALYRKRTFISKLAWRIKVVIESIYRGLIYKLFRPAIDGTHLPIKYGDLVLFRHFTTGQYLTSIPGHKYNHAGSSEQQKTFTTPIPDIYSVWCVEPWLNQRLEDFIGQTVSTNSVIRLRAPKEYGYLHSHTNLSPGAQLRGDKQREVSVTAHLNIEDEWKVRSPEASMVTGVKLRLEHHHTGYFLHSHTGGMAVSGRDGCMEMTCCDDGNDDDLWILSFPKYEQTLVT